MGDEQYFDSIFADMNRKRRRIVSTNMQRRPYWGTRQDKELKDAKDRARAHQGGESGDL